MRLTKHNTALDLSKLTKGELKEAHNFDLLLETEADYHYFYHSKISDIKILFLGSRGRYEMCTELYLRRRNYTIVDFPTFKSIHFPESSSWGQEDGKPTYEELVEAYSNSADYTIYYKPKDDPDSSWKVPRSELGIDPFYRHGGNLFRIFKKTPEKPTYEELVFALRELCRVSSTQEAVYKLNCTDARWRAVKLLERIQS